MLAELYQKGWKSPEVAFARESLGCLKTQLIVQPLVTQKLWDMQARWYQRTNQREDLCLRPGTQDLWEDEGSGGK